MGSRCGEGTYVYACMKVSIIVLATTYPTSYICRIVRLYTCTEVHTEYSHICMYVLYSYIHIYIYA